MVRETDIFQRQARETPGTIELPVTVLEDHNKEALDEFEIVRNTAVLDAKLKGDLKDIRLKLATVKYDQINLDKLSEKTTSRRGSSRGVYFYVVIFDSFIFCILQTSLNQMASVDSGVASSNPEKHSEEINVEEDAAAGTSSANANRCKKACAGKQSATESGNKLFLKIDRDRDRFDQFDQKRIPIDFDHFDQKFGGIEIEIIDRHFVIDAQHW
ncbi:hypothetical protein OUZ56_009547 [Daphnia magna]|uniref:Uncharacterized protein n=1 Tax=Daphnia magna TaxID=35525 RepID=A0ABR0AGJ8_9CRUS|nr:hypothetical protein OUZ56_009547 [Daphnia magna]